MVGQDILSYLSFKLASSAISLQVFGSSYESSLSTKPVLCPTDRDSVIILSANIPPSSGVKSVGDNLFFEVEHDYPSRERNTVIDFWFWHCTWKTPPCTYELLNQAREVYCHAWLSSFLNWYFTHPLPWIIECVNSMFLCLCSCLCLSNKHLPNNFNKNQFKTLPFVVLFHFRLIFFI